MRFNPLQSKLISCAFAFSLGAPNGRPSTVFTFRFAFVEPMLLQKLKTAHLLGRSKLADTAHKGPQFELQALHYFCCKLRNTDFSQLYDPAALREVQKLLKKHSNPSPITTAVIFFTAYFPFSGLAMKHEVMLFCNYFIINPPSLGLIMTVCILSAII